MRKPEWSTASIVAFGILAARPRAEQAVDNVYYRAPGDQTKVKAIPLGLQLLATQERYNRNPPAPFRDTPPYKCTDTWTTSINFSELHQHEQAQRRGAERGLQSRRRLPEHALLSDPAHQLPHQPPQLRRQGGEPSDRERGAG